MEKVRLTDICDFQGGSQPPKDEWLFEKQDRIYSYASNTRLYSE